MAAEGEALSARLVSLVLISACATTGPLRMTRTYSAPADEVFDAAWLAVEARGFAVEAEAFELHATRGNTRWALEVSALGNEQRLTFAPEGGTSRAEFEQVIEPFEADVQHTLSTWREVPEATFDGRRNQLRVPGFALELPASWELLDFDVTHRGITVQPKRTRTAVQSTLRIELDRRRPRSLLEGTARRAMGLALTARNRLTFPEALEQGAIRVLDGSSPQAIAWYGEIVTLGTLELRVALACPGTDAAACKTAFTSLQRLAMPQPTSR